MFVKIEKNPDGSHEFQSGGNLENGWAIVPPTVEIPNTFPFVNIEVAEVIHPAVTVNKVVEGVEKTMILVPEITQLEVITMNAMDVPEEPAPVHVPSTDEVLDALLGVK